MKHVPFKFLGLVLILNLLYLSSCKKVNTDTLPVSDFYWKLGNTEYSTNTDTAFFSYSGIKIVATTNSDFSSTIKGPSIYLNSYGVGKYSLKIQGSNQLIYFDNAGEENLSTDGSLEITSNTNNYLTGFFNATLVNSLGIENTISGTFTDIQLRP
jgi:hypothetical protein